MNNQHTKKNCESLDSTLRAGGGGLPHPHSGMHICACMVYPIVSHPLVFLITEIESDGRGGGGAGILTYLCIYICIQCGCMVRQIEDKIININSHVPT